jgi:hypothetical protein
MSIRIRIEQVIDETTGIVTREVHFKNDKQHRDDDHPNDIHALERTLKTASCWNSALYLL